MKAIALTCFLFALGSGRLAAQGARLNDPYAKKSPVLRDTVRDRPAPPEHARVLPALPVPGNQSQVNSCTGFAVVHAMLLMHTALAGTTAAEARRGSGSYLYNHVFEKDCSNGAYLSRALAWAQHRGVCPRSQFSDDALDCDPKPSTAHDLLASRCRLDTFYLVFNAKTSSTEKLTWVKQQLDWKKPVVIDLQVDPGFFQLRSRDWRPPKRAATDRGHALVVVGYDERDGKHEFLLMNSRGPDWGDQGYCTMTYADFLVRAEHGYIIEF
jgi:hypothetical protein